MGLLAIRSHVDTTPDHLNTQFSPPTTNVVAYGNGFIQLDQDFDGYADSCDLCPFAHDPDNRIYVDPGGMEWPNDGWYCNGDYSTNALDPADGCFP